MQVLVTGACGYVGAALVRRLLGGNADLPRPLQRLTAVDRYFGLVAEPWRDDPRMRLIEGDIADPETLHAALAHEAPDWLFHLASVPGSAAERDQALGLRANLFASIALLERLAEMAAAGDVAPRVVFASSVAVYGELPNAGRINETWPTQPVMTYGAHKLMIETLLADVSRRSPLNGISLRLPGIVARPLSPTGHGSAFMSDLIRSVGGGVPYECPVSADAQAWWMSLPCCIDNLMHAARIRTLTERCVQLPVITASVQAVVAAVEAVNGRAAEVCFTPDQRTMKLFGRMPGLEAPMARRLGFTDDGSLTRLVINAMALDSVESIASK